MGYRGYGEVLHPQPVRRERSRSSNPYTRTPAPPSLLEKVIAYMTLGIDVSRLFTEMMLAIETRDLVVKKMVYLYLCTYARQKPDLAIMCINTLQRDWYVTMS